jgi:hypothetical protein
VPLSEAGFDPIEMHPTFGFLLSDIGFPVENDKPRKEARARIEKMLEETPDTEGS